jgi:hypothetical protein
MLVQWKDELESKFGLTFDIIDRERVGELRRRRGFSVNPWTTGLSLPHRPQAAHRRDLPTFRETSQRRLHVAAVTRSLDCASRVLNLELRFPRIVTTGNNAI